MSSARAIWSGFIRFSLVSIPVKGYTGTRSDGGGTRFNFNQLHKDCGARIKLAKTCPVHGEVKSDDIVSGYEYSDGQYAVMDPEELMKLRMRNNRTIGVENFLPLASFSPRYFNGSTMYLVPDGPAGHKPYALLQRVMTEQKRAAFATGVFRNREQTVLLRPESRMLVAHFLNFDAAVRPSAEFEPQVPTVEIPAKEVELAKTLVEQMTEQKLDLSQYRDKYGEEMAKLVEAKIKGEEIIAAPAEEEPELVVNLMEALQKSLDKAVAKNKPPKMVAPSSAKRGAATASPAKRRKIS